jgi:penicillin-binding protein 2
LKRLKTIQKYRLIFKIILFLLIFSVISACLADPFNVPTKTPTTHQGNLLNAAAAQSIAEQFLGAWQTEDYDAMYDVLSTFSKDAFTRETFEEIYQQAAVALTLESIDVQVLSTMAGEYFAESAFRATLSTRVLGELSREMVMNLEKENNNWRVKWEPGLILPELHGGNFLEFIQQVPSRGRIFDRYGAPLAAYENAISIGLVPGEILPEQADLLYETLSEMSSFDPQTLAVMVEATPDDWYLPVVTLAQADAAPHLEALEGLSGIRLDEFRSRFYVDGGVAPHALGYMLFIPEEEMDAYLRLGYRQDERIGATGLEAVYEFELSGQRGGSLYLKGPEGQIISLLANSEPVPGQSVYTTLDKQLQMKVQDSLGDLRAAVVVMEAESGRVLALVSNPDFDPNAFDLTEIDRSLLESYFTDEDRPLFNRATQGQYPLGSVFKTISMATALETEVYSVYSSLYCGHSLWVCDRVTLYDWTLAYGTSASGQLSLPEGLMRSCNPWFYTIGETLYEEDLPDALTNMAYGFGLGVETGIDIPEEGGNIPLTASNCLENAQMAIGQGEILVTPIQVAAFFAALANGGTLYRPALVERIQSNSGDITYSFEPESRGNLPISSDTLSAVQEGLRLVVEETRGTGYWAMGDLQVPVSGKTGTAQTPTGNSHAWFAGYTRQNDPERPDIAVVVLIENGGEGSAMAAPVFRRVVSLYFSNYEDPGGIMPWEVEPYILPTPTATPEEDSPSGD